MLLLLLSGLMLAGAAVALTVRAFSLGAVRRQQTLTQVLSYGYGARVEQPHPARTRRGVRAAFDRLADRIGRLALAQLPGSRRQELVSLLRRAGLYHTEPERFLGYRVLATVAPAALLLWLVVSAGAFGPRAIVVLCLFGGLGWVLPSFALKRRGTVRLQQIDRELPELVDLLVTTIEAGVGFAAAIQLVSRRVKGPLGQELRLVLQEQGMGLTVEQSLQNMLARSEGESVRAFVQAIVQGQTLGVSIGKILRDLAVDMRKRRRQRAEERAQKAPTKILFPVIFLILPALLIVALVGPLLGLGQMLGTG